MDKSTLEKRIRQILATDKNAVDIYTDLANKTEAGELKDKLLKLIQDEKRHVSLSEQMLSLLGAEA